MHAADHTANRRRTISVRASHEQSALPRRATRRRSRVTSSWSRGRRPSCKRVDTPSRGCGADAGADRHETRSAAARFASGTTAETRAAGFGRCVLVVGDDGRRPTRRPRSRRSWRGGAENRGGGQGLLHQPLTTAELRVRDPPTMLRGVTSRSTSRGSSRAAPRCVAVVGDKPDGNGGRRRGLPSPAAERADVFGMRGFPGVGKQGLQVAGTAGRGAPTRRASRPTRPGRGGVRC